MSRVLTSAVLLFASFASVAADDLKVSQLEQDVRNLQRQVQQQAQQIEELRMQLLRPGETRTPVAATTAPTVTGSWVDAARWQRVHTGMSELEVISTLGAPTSMRATEGERVLLYAMEIGASGFLSGSVTLRARAVVDVQKPVIK